MLSCAFWIWVYLSQYKAWAEILSLAFHCLTVSSTCWRAWTAIFIKSPWHMPVHFCACYVCSGHTCHSACVEVKGRLVGIGSLFHPSSGIELRLPCLVASAVSHWAISLALNLRCQLVISVRLGLSMFTTANCSLQHKTWTWSCLRVLWLRCTLLF